MGWVTTPLVSISTLSPRLKPRGSQWGSVGGWGCGGCLKFKEPLLDMEDSQKPDEEMSVSFPLHQRPIHLSAAVCMGVYLTASHTPICLGAVTHFNIWIQHTHLSVQLPRRLHGNDLNVYGSMRSPTWAQALGSYSVAFPRALTGNLIGSRAAWI